MCICVYMYTCIYIYMYHLFCFFLTNFRCTSHDVFDSWRWTVSVPAGGDDQRLFQWILPCYNGTSPGHMVDKWKILSTLNLGLTECFTAPMLGGLQVVALGCFSWWDANLSWIRLLSKNICCHIRKLVAPSPLVFDLRFLAGVLFVLCNYRSRAVASRTGKTTWWVRGPRAMYSFSSRNSLNLRTVKWRNHWTQWGKNHWDNGLNLN